MLLKKSARNISEVVQWRCLQTTTKFLPLIYTDLSHYYPGSIQQDINDRVILYQREYSSGKTKCLPTSYSAATRDLIIQFLHEVSTKMEQLIQPISEQQTEPEAERLT